MMIKRTFSHLPGISESTEQKLWKDGLHDWENLYNNCHKIFSDKKSTKILLAIDESVKKLESGDLFHFYNVFSRRHLWRLLPGNEKYTSFIDIETTGLSMPPIGKVTTLSFMLNGKLFQAYETLEKKKLVKKIREESKLIVSYYGEVFDIPYIKRQYKTELPIAHVDLCFALRRHGLSGGLKAVEKNAGISYKRKLTGLDGFDAVKLWNLYENNGNIKALHTLLAYNAEDTIILQPLAEKLLQLETKSLIEKPIFNYNENLPSIKFKACRELVKKIMSERQVF